MHGESAEIAYYRSVEDLFSSLRGTPHVLSPRDFQLLRSWWRDDVPLAAVTAALTEVFTRNAERDDADPVTTLAYCRHAVKRHAKRLAEMRVGAADRGDGEAREADVSRSVRELRVAAARLEADRREVAAVVERTAGQVELAGKDLPIEMLDEHLFQLESIMLIDCRAALGEAELRAIDENVEAAAASAASEDARRRMINALRDRELRLLLDLPRLEIDV